MDKKSLSERDICTKFITPAVKKAGCVKDGMPALLRWPALLSMRQRSLPMFHLCSNLLGIGR